MTSTSLWSSESLMVWAQRAYRVLGAQLLGLLAVLVQAALDVIAWVVALVDATPVLEPIKMALDLGEAYLGLRTDIEFGRHSAAFLLDARRLQLLDLTVADVWEATARRHRGHAAVVFEGRTLTFQQIDEAANRMANFFLSKGIVRGDVVALFLENKPEYIICWLGLSKIGAVVALLNNNLKTKSLLHCITVSNCKMVIFGPETETQIADVYSSLAHERVRVAENVQVFILGGASQTGAAQIDVLVASMPSTLSNQHRKGVRCSDTWGFVYTSGTTGLPKAAIIKHQRFWATSSGFCRSFSVTSSDRVYTVLPLYHAAGGMLGAGAMVIIGATLVLRRKFSASQFMKDVSENNVTVIQYIGELCRYLLNTAESRYDRAHKIRLALGNGLRPDIWEKFQSRFNIPTIGEFYAATEGNATLINTVTLSDPRGRGAVGRAGFIVRAILGLKLVKFDIEKEEPMRDAKGRCIECNYDEPGELMARIVTGDVARDYVGYHGNKEGTQKKIVRNAFVPGDAWFRTGDLLRRDRSGCFYFVDRIGDTFRWKGENVSTNEVAEVVSSFEGIAEANVYGVEVPGKDGRAGMAAIVLKSEFDMQALGEHVARVLPVYAVPLFVRCLPAMDTTGTFKHQKTELRKAGINPGHITDPLFIFNADLKAYEAFTSQSYDALCDGRIRV